MSIEKDKSILNRIDQLRLESDDILLERQKNHIPCIYNILLEPKNGYYYEGKYYSLNSESSVHRKKTKIYLSKNIPFAFSNNHERYIDTLLNLVAKNKIVPFIILADGIFIKWSNITIVKDDHYRYIIISGLDDIEDIDNIDFKCILLPCAIRYGEDQNVISVKNESHRFYFNVDGYLTDNVSDINTRIEIIDPDISGYVYNSFEDDIFKIYTDKYGQITSTDNLLFISDDKFDFDILDSIEYIGHNYYRSNSSLEGFKLYSYTYNKLEKSNSLHYNIGNDEAMNNFIDYTIRNNIDNTTKDLISNSFNFTYDRNLSFKENISNSIKYITKYDNRLLDSIYKKNLKIITEHYTGKQLLDKRNEDGIVTIPRRLTDKKFDNYIMIFHNDLLYRFHSRIRYENNKVSFPLVNVEEEDTFEIIFFYGINNEIGKFTVHEENETIFIDNRFDLSNCLLYCNKIEGEIFEIDSPTDGSQIKVDFTYEEVDDNLYKLVLSNPFYYGKELGISNPNQFRYVHYNAIKDMVGFQLPKEFAYCRDIDRYMIFINGRKIDKNYFELVSDEFDTPIFDLSIYSKIPLYKGSYIDIFYLPYSFDIISSYEENLNDRDIIIDDSKLSYRLNNYAYLYFINGKKINENELVEITRNKIRLSIDPQSKLHLEILRHIDPIDSLTDLFIESDYDRYIESLTDDEIKNIIGGIDFITDTEEDIYNETITHRQLVYEVVKDYYMNVDNPLPEEFVYGYDESIISEEDKDNNNNYVIRLTDASYEDKADLYNTN